MLVNRILLGSAAFGLSFGLSFAAERNVQRSLLTGLIAPGAYAGAVALDDRQKRRVKLAGQAIAGQLQAAEQRQAELEQALLTATTKKQAAETSLSYLQTEIEQLKAQIQTQKQREQELGQAIATLEGRKQQLEASFQQLQDRVEGLSSQEKEIQQAIATTSQERQTLAVEVARLNQELGQLQTQLTGVTEQKLQLSSEVATLQTTKQLLESNAADLQTQIQTLERSRQTLTDSLIELSAIDVQPLQSEIQSLSSTFISQKAELASVLESLLAEVKQRLAEAGETSATESRDLTLLPRPELPLVVEPEPAAENIELPGLVLLPRPELQVVEESESLEETFLTPNWHTLINQLSDSEYWALDAILRGDGEALKQIADAVPTMPQILIEAINEKASEIVDDLIFEPGTSSLIPQIYEEYEESLRLAIAVVGRDKSPVTTIDVPVKSYPEQLPLKLKTWQCCREFEGTANVLAIAADGTTLISGGSDNHIQLRDLKTGDVQTLENAHSGQVYAIAVHPKADRFFSGGGDGTIKVWSLKTSKNLETLKAHAGAVRALTISSNGQWLASGSLDKSVKLWNPKTGKLIRTLAGQAGLVNTLAFSPKRDQRLLVAGVWDGSPKLLLWNFQYGSPDVSPFALFEHHHKIAAIAVSPDGETLLSADVKGLIKLWDLRINATADHLDLKGHTPVMALSSDGKTLVIGSDDGMIRLWDLDAEEQSPPFAAHQKAICAIAFGPDSDTFVTSSADQTIKVWQYS